MKVYCIYMEGVLLRLFDSLEKAESYVESMNGDSYLSIVEKVVE